MPEPKYQRLTRERAPGKLAVTSLSRSSLWLGSDHLLFVESNGYTENYKRFYFRDIQAITMRMTRARSVWNLILIPPMVICLACCDYSALAAGAPGPGTIVALCLAFFVFGIPLLLNNLFGTSCAGQIRTAVQSEDLPSLRRVRQTHRVLGKILPLIAAAQGQLAPEEVSARMQEMANANTARQSIPPVIAGAPPVIS
jgi:hypothetical protein